VVLRTVQRREGGGATNRNTNTESLAGYTTLDFRFRLPLGDRLTLFGGVENLFDQRYQVFAGFPDGGRSWRLGVSGAF
jgi:vitamin B12 transporter